MPTLREELDLIMRFLKEKYPQVSFGEQCAREMEMMIRKSYGGERVYLPPADSRKDPSRVEALREAARKLPTGVVAERHGVSRSWVHRVVKLKK